MKQKTIRWLGLMLAVAIIVGTVRACQLLRQPLPSATNSAEDEGDTAPGLSLKDVTLEQPDETGSLLWRVHADEVRYSPDQQTAEVINPDGELFQDGEVIYRVRANRGDVRQDGEFIFLRGNIVATGVENNLVLRGQEMEWRPQDGLLLVRDRINSTHPQLKASAQEARIYNRDGRLELEQDVVATTNEAPYLRLEAERLTWMLDEETVRSDGALKVEQLKGEPGSLAVSDRVTGDQGELDLAALIVELTQNVEVELLEQPVGILSDIAIWNVNAETLTVPGRVRITQPEQSIRVTANRGDMDLSGSIVTLSQGVQAISQDNQSRLNAARVIWNLTSSEITAEGNVDYRQSDPPVTITGPRAVGRLEAQTVVVSGGNVITEITPQ
ncbi:MAG: LPS export ABC transporter periplasmic protein LptC [Cyanobacteria bacterium P01_D01_bin.128]